MDANENEIHPLDRDYSVPSAPEKKQRSNLSKLHRIGFSVFAAGFACVFLAAIVLGVFPGGGWFEAIGSFMHRLAMYLILVGGIMVLAAYQNERREAEARQRPRRDRTTGPSRRSPPAHAAAEGNSLDARDGKTKLRCPQCQGLLEPGQVEWYDVMFHGEESREAMRLTGQYGTEGKRDGYRCPDCRYVMTPY